MARALWYLVDALPVFAAWSAIAGAVGAHRDRADLRESAWRALVTAAGAALAALVGAVWFVAKPQLDVRIAGQVTSLEQPARYALQALGASVAGSSLAVALVIAVAGIVVASRRAAAGRAWAVAFAGAAMVIPAIAAAIGGPFAARTAAEGAGISGLLQHDIVGVRLAAGLVAIASAFASIAESVTALRSRDLGAAWDRRTARWNAITWSAALTAALTDASTHAFIGPTVRWPEAADSVLWLLAAAVGAWLVALDRQPRTADRAVVRLILGAASWTVVASSLVAGGGRLLPYASSAPGFIWFAAVPALGIVALVWGLRTGRGALAGVAASGGSQRLSWADAVRWAGMAAIVAALAASRASRSQVVQLGNAEIFRARDAIGGQWQFASQGISTLERENYAAVALALLPVRNGLPGPIVVAEHRSYLLADGDAPGGPIGVGAVIRGWLVDARVVSLNPDGKRPTIRVTFVPLASWAIAGVALAALGALFGVATRREEAA